jgi:hypothetical protein
MSPHHVTKQRHLLLGEEFSAGASEQHWVIEEEPLPRRATLRQHRLQQQGQPLSTKEQHPHHTQATRLLNFYCISLVIHHPHGNIKTFSHFQDLMETLHNQSQFYSFKLYRSPGNQIRCTLSLLCVSN